MSVQVLVREQGNHRWAKIDTLPFSGMRCQVEFYQGTNCERAFPCDDMDRAIKKATAWVEGKP